MQPPSEPQPKSPIEPNAILVRFGVNCGDHAETHRQAIHVTRDTTVGELIDVHLTRYETWHDMSEADTNKTIELRAITEGEPR